MPITQDRLKKLADAAQSVVATHISQCATLGEMAAKYRAGKLELEHLLEYVENRSALATIAIASEMTIINTEMYHYMFSHNKNEQEARRVARRREERKLGLERGTLTPASTVPSTAKMAEEFTRKRKQPARRDDPRNDPDANFANEENIIEHVSQEPSLEAKQKIAEFLQTQQAAAEFAPKPGYREAQHICTHDFAELGEPCPNCGKEIPKASQD